MSTTPLQATPVPEKTVIEAAAFPHVMQMIPSAHPQRGRHERQNLASMMRGLGLQDHPVALEIAGTDQQRRLLIRARAHEDLLHMETQLQARFPNAQFLPLVGQDDPFRLGPGETVSCVELQAGQASYHPLQDFDPKTSDDPVLGILGALDALPSDLRAITQIALVPAPSTWSQPHQRKALEHALDPERQQDREKMAAARGDAGAPSRVLLVLGGLFLAAYFLSRRYPNLLPGWLATTFQLILHGQWQQVFSGPYRLEVAGLLGVLLLLLMRPLLVKRFWKKLFKQPVYDMRNVAEKTSRVAYQVRLRLYVIGPQGGVIYPKNNRTLYTFKFLSIEVPIDPKQRALELCRQWQARRKQQARRQQQQSRLIAAYRQYHLASGNYFVPRRTWEIRARRLVDRGTWWKGVSSSKHFLDVEALAALWHPPADEALPDLARVIYRQSRSRLLPPSLERAQYEMPIGYSEHAGHQVAFGFPADCLKSHMLIDGKSGEGKSTLMLHLALRNMLEKKGMILIDPHGDLADEVLALVPEDRADDVMFVDLSEELFAWGINPLDFSMARGRDKSISDLIKIFSKMWATWGSRMEISFEYSLRTLFEANRYLCKEGRKSEQWTLLDIIAVLTDESFCHSLLEHIKDPFVLRWWTTYYDPLSLQMQRDRIDPVLSKIAKFEGTIARHIVGQSLCSIDFAECIEQQKIVLIKLAKGVVGEDVARILGASILGFLNIAIEEQGKLEAAKRKHLPIFIDEFQTLEGVDWSVLGELRKFGATFFLATQSLEYLRKKEILPVVLANVKQFAIFRTSADDANLLYKELDVDPEDIVHQESLTCYLKLLSNWRQHPTFSCSLRFLSGNKTHAQRIREDCQRRYMHPVKDVDDEIFARLARQIGAAPTPEKEASKEDPKGKARENGGYRGRKSQEKKSEEKKPITPMNWEETVGSPPDEPDQAEQEQESDA